MPRVGLPGKPDGISGADVEQFYREGRIREIAEYCEGDVVRGRLSHAEFEASDAGLIEFIKARGNTKPHLVDLT